MIGIWFLYFVQFSLKDIKQSSQSKDFDILFYFPEDIKCEVMQLCSLVTAPHYYRLHICIFNCYVVLVAAPGSGQITIAAIAATLRGPVTT